MARARVTTWKANDSSVSLEATLSSACPAIFLDEVYKSEDMRTGIDAARLSFWDDDLLAPLIQLDPRGGFFSQVDVYEAVKALSQTAENSPHVEKIALANKLTTERFLFLLFVVGQCLTGARSSPTPLNKSFCGRAMPDSSFRGLWSGNA